MMRYDLPLQLIGGLADEKVRWAESVATFDSMLVNVVGDVMVSAGAVTYLGPFTVSPRAIPCGLGTRPSRFPFPVCTCIHVAIHDD